MDASSDASGQDDFSLFDTIAPLSDDERSSVLTELADVECNALVSALSGLGDLDLPRVREALVNEDGGSWTNSLLDDPTLAVGAMSRKQRSELLGSLIAAFEELDITIDLREALREGAERVRDLRATVFRDSLRYAADLAKKHRGGLDWSTALLAACHGLETTLDRFEPWRGYKFSTYATYWIRHHVGRYRQDRATTLRIPVHVREKMYAYRQAERDLWTGESRPTVQAVVDSLGEDGPAAGRAMVHAGPVLEATVDDGRTPELPLAELVEDVQVPTLWDGGSMAAWPALAVEQLAAAIADLGPGHKGERAREVLWRRLAIDRDKPETLQEIGDSFGVSRERVRQIEAKALGTLKLKHNDGAEVRPWRWRHRK